MSTFFMFLQKESKLQMFLFLHIIQMKKDCFSPLQLF